MVESSPVARLLAAALVLAAVAGGLAWAAASAPGGGEAGARAGDHRTLVVAPDGRVLADGVAGGVATPLAALLALADAQGFRVDVERQPWVGGGCTADYVRAIAGHAESSTGGWNYYVRAPGGAWRWQPEGAGCHALEDGAEVEWCWVELDVCRHHAA